MSNYNSKSEIERYFQSIPRANTFIEFCNENNIKRIRDITPDVFEKLKYEKGIGAGTLIRIQENYNKVIRLHDEIIKDKENPYPLSFINAEFNNLNTIDLVYFNVSNNCIYELNKLGSENLKDIKMLHKDFILNHIDICSYLEIIQELTLLEYNLAEIVAKKFDLFKKEKNFKFLFERAHGKTLQEIGNEVNFTRQGVNQVENKLISKSISFYENTIFIVLGMKKKTEIRVEEIREYLINDDFLDVLIYVIKKSNKFVYVDFADMLIVKNTETAQLNTILTKITRDIIEDCFDFSNNMKEIEELLKKNNVDYIDVNDFLEFLKQNKYKQYGDYVIKGNQSYAVLCREVIKKHFIDGINVYDNESLNKLRELTNKYYKGLNIGERNKALQIRICNYLVLCDRGMYTHPEKISISDELLNEIVQYINTNPNKRIFFSEIFDEFQGILNMTSNVDNKYYLHGVLKYYFDGKFEFKRDYLEKTEGVTLNIGERIKVLLNNKGQAVSKSEIHQELPGISDVVIFNSIMNESKIIQWEYNYYNSIDNIKISTEDINILGNILEEVVRKYDGYCSEELLYDASIKELKEMFELNQIAGASNLFYIANYYFSKSYVFRRPHIMSKLLASNGTSMKDVALSLLKDTNILNFNKYIELASCLKWSPITYGVVFSDIEKDYIRISDVDYIKKDIFYISEDILSELKNKIQEHLLGYDCYAIQNIFDYHKFPEFKYEWNGFLVKSLIKEYKLGYKIIEPDAKDRRYLRGIIVNEDLDISRYDELIAHVMKSDNINNIKEYELCSYLRLKGLINKVIPRELYNSEYMKYENEIFTII